MDIAAIRTALAGAAAAIPGLNTYDFIPNMPAEPAFYPADVEVDFDAHSFGGRGDEVRVTCRILSSKADDVDGIAALDAYLGRGARSLKTALEAARGAPGESALGGACDDFRVVRISNYRLYAHGDTDFYGAELIVMCIGEGDGE